MASQHLHVVDQSDPEIVESMKYLQISREERLRLDSQPFDSKKMVWIPDPKLAYVAAEIVGTKGDDVEVKLRDSNEKRNVKKDLIEQMNPPKFEMCEDMADLTFLNDASVYHNLEARYKSWLIYTYSGLFCVVINPYKRLPIYTDKIVAIYRGKKRNELPPHLYSISDNAYSNMLRDRENQSMLITGESGAGKTENTKKVIQYFATVAAATEKTKSNDNKANLEDQIVSANPLMESYGNAKTVRNNNSSRFGKFIRIHFGSQGKIAGADIATYLLEKARVIFQQPSERNYHIFYQLTSSAATDLQSNYDYKILDFIVRLITLIEAVDGMFPQQYKSRILSLWKRILREVLKILRTFQLRKEDNLRLKTHKKGTVTVEGIDDAEEMKNTIEATKILGFSDEETMNMFKCTASLMHFGNSKWKQRPREEQAECEETENCDKVAFLLGIEAADLIKGLLKPRIKVGNEYVNKGQNKDQVTYAIGALSKSLYERMFKWMIEKINETLDVKTTRQYFIGVLDIAGFEIFDFNGFEQLCINYTNEMLQQFFNHHMFVLEQDEYKKEGIEWEFIDFGMDLQACIDLIEKPMGILSMLEEECIVPKGSDEGFAQKLGNFYFGKHPNITKPKAIKGKPAADFDLHHYAGIVPYTVTGWLEKNKDPINNTVAALFSRSKNSLLSLLFAEFQEAEPDRAKTKGKRGGSMQTISAMHREQLNTLMTHLRSTHPHFVRCIIPNEKKREGELDPFLVLNQLHCNGVLEGIRICRKGFPNRMIYAEFKQRYSILAPNAVPKGFVDAKKATIDILKAIQLSTDLYKIGHTKIFFKAGVLGQLEDMRDEAFSKVLALLQARIRSYVMKLRYKLMLDQKLALEILQRNCKRYLDFRNWPWWKLYTRVKPLLSVARQEDEMKKLQEDYDKIKDSFEKEEALRKQYEEQNARLVKEKNDMFLELEAEKSNTSAAEEKAERLIVQKANLESQMDDLKDRIQEEEDAVADLSNKKRKLEQELDERNSALDELKITLQKSENENKAKENQIRSFQIFLSLEEKKVVTVILPARKTNKSEDEISRAAETNSRISNEKKRLEQQVIEMSENLQQDGEKMNSLNKMKVKLEQSLDELEDKLEREKKARADAEKSKKNLENQLKATAATVDDLERLRSELEDKKKTKEQEVVLMNNRLEDEQRQVAALNKKIKELQSHIDDIEEELETEKQGRMKAEKQRADLSREMAEMGDKLQEAGGTTAAQSELTKKREAELSKLRRDLEEASVQHESTTLQLRKRHQDAVNEMGEQIDQLQKMKSRLEKDKQNLSSENGDLKMQLDHVMKAKISAEKFSKALEQQMSEVNVRLEEVERQVNDLESQKGRLQNENSESAQRIDELEHNINTLNKSKQQLQNELNDARRQLEEEVRAKSSLVSQLRNITADFESTKESLEEEIESKTEIQKQISSLNSELQQWRSRYESEGLARAEELEEAKRKLSAKLVQAEEQVEQALNKCVQLEKVKQRLQGEVEDLMMDIEKANSNAITMEKKQKQFDKLIADWKKKCEDVALELEASQREARSYSSELFKLRSKYEETQQEIETLKVQNKNLSDEIKDIMEQSSEDMRNIHQVQQDKKKLEMEREELQSALEEAEGALEQEEAKSVRLQMELSTVRQEIDRRLREKEEEFDATRRNYQRTIESVQASVEAETRAKQEAIRQKKKLEGDVNELEVSLDQSNRTISDLQKSIQRAETQLKELQELIEEEQRKRDEAREAAASAERRANALSNELEELRVSAEQSDNARRVAEMELVEASDRIGELSAFNANLGSQKRHLESSMTSLQADLDEAISELKNSEERSRKAASDAARLAEELRSEQEHSMAQEGIRKSLEQQVRDLQSRYEELEANATKGSKRVIQKLEEKILSITGELDVERHNYQEALKVAKRAERRVKELTTQIEEDRKLRMKLQETIDKLENKIRTYKRQVEEAEEVAAMNLAKYRKVTQDLDGAEERADTAETMLNKLRAKSRGALSAAGGSPGRESRDGSRAPSIYSRASSVRR